MARVTYLLYQYPQLSESYASTELRAVSPDHEIDVISLNEADCLCEDGALPYRVIGDETEILERTRDFKPDIIHTHWLGPRLGVSVRLARALDVPLTIRAHSFDVLWKKPRRRWYRRSSSRDTSPPIAENLDFLRSDSCLGILTFPFSTERLAGAGIPEEKLIPCRPVLDYERFHDESPNAPGVLNGGAALPKKDFFAYLELGRLVPELDFDLYPIGYGLEKLRERNEELNNPVKICEAVPQREMPTVYKDHNWLVYTADREIGTVGWPVSISEAQAAGVGICIPNLRPDIRDLVGPAGFVYDTIEEAADIIRQPYPDSMREEGFRFARLSDVREHIHLLTDLWKAA